MTVAGKITRSLFQEHPLSLLRKVKRVPIHCLRELLIQKFNAKFSPAYISQRLNGIREMSDLLAEQISTILNDIDEEAA